MKKIKLALLAIAFAGSTAAMAQDKATLIKQFIDLQKPGIESLASGLVQQSTAPIAQAGSQYLETQVPAEKRESAAKAADAELKKYYEQAFPIVRDKAVAVAPEALTPVLEQTFSEEELRQLIAWISSPLSKKYQDANPKLQEALTAKVVAETRSTIQPKLETLNTNVASALGATGGAAGGAPARKSQAPAKSSAAPSNAPAKK